MKYGALKFNSTNIGDEIQSIAEQRFLPQVDYYIFREQMHKFTTADSEKGQVDNEFLVYVET